MLFSALICYVVEYIIFVSFVKEQVSEFKGQSNQCHIGRFHPFSGPIQSSNKHNHIMHHLILKHNRTDYFNLIFEEF